MTIEATTTKTAKQQGFSTRQIHAGYTPAAPIAAAVPPIYQTTSYVFENCEQAAARFGLQEPGQIYTRITNPNHDILEARLADLEGGVGALLTASGTSAIFATILTLATAGNSVVSSPSLYGGTHALFQDRLKTLGIEVRFVTDPGNAQEWIDLADDTTVAFFGETIPNPRNDILDIEAIAEAAHSVGVPLIVDNTVATPYLTRPLEWGADIVVHSVTKYLAGHGNSILGAIIDGGKFDWDAHADRFPLLTQADEAYHGLRYADLGETAFITRARVATLRDYGVNGAPFNAFLATLGIDTLSLRLERHCASALEIAKHLEQHPLVESVSYAGLESSPWHNLQQKYAPKGASGVVTFDVKGGAKAGQTLVDSLQLFTHLVNIGDVRSLVAHPASTTHAQCDEAGLEAAGITPGTVRLSVGLEDVADLIADLDQALDAATTASEQNN